MAESIEPTGETPAEKAPAPVVDVPTAVVPEAAVPDAPETPAKRGRKPSAAVKPVSAPPAIAAPATIAAAKPRRGRPPKSVLPAQPAAKLAVKRAAAKASPAKASPSKAATTPVRTPAVIKIKTAPKTAKPSTVVPGKIPFIAQLKEIPMDMTSSFKDAVDGAQEKAKEAFTKTSALAGEYGEFAKGNVEAFVESGKILATGLKDIGSTFVADSKSVFETMTSEVKELAAVKSPTDFFKLQTELLRRNFDSAVAYSSKTSEAMMKLTNEVIAPISGRVTLAVEKVRKAA